MARKSKLAPVVVESTVQDELSAAMSAMVSAPVADGDVLVQAETVVLTESTVEIPVPVEITDDLGEFGPQIQADAEVVEVEDTVLFAGLTVQKFCRAVWKFKPAKGTIRIEQPDGSMKAGNNKCLDSLWLDSQNPRNLTQSPYYLIARASGYCDLMLQPE